jgi:hypothetical protein
MIDKKEEKEKKRNIPGKPPSLFRSHKILSCVVICPSFIVPCHIVTVNTPPVLGTRATSPRSVLNVERSSWANCDGLRVSIGIDIGYGCCGHVMLTVTLDIEFHTCPCTI